jgi:hypothetical protein
MKKTYYLDPYLLSNILDWRTEFMKLTYNEEVWNKIKRIRKGLMKLYLEKFDYDTENYKTNNNFKNRYYKKINRCSEFIYLKLNKSNFHNLWNITTDYNKNNINDIKSCFRDFFNYNNWNYIMFNEYQSDHDIENTDKLFLLTLNYNNLESNYNYGEFIKH